MKAFITGGAGYIGSHLAKELIANCFEVVIIDNLSKSGNIDDELSNFLVSLDISDPRSYEDLRDLLSTGMSDDVVFHLAAKKSVSESINSPVEYKRNNLSGTANLLKAISESKMKKLIFSSSASVYGTGKKFVSENDRLEPANPYASIKLEEETLIRNEVVKGNLGALIFRFFNVAGARSSQMIEEVGENLIPQAVSFSKTGKVLNIYGNDYPTRDGTCIRDYIHVLDVVDALISGIEFCQTNGLGILNLGTGSGTSVLEVVSELQKHLMLETSFTIRRPGDVPYLIADSSLALKLIGWKANRTISQIIQSSIPMS